MDYTKVPANLINKYLWDRSKGLVSGKAKVSNVIWGFDVDSISYNPFFPASENTGTVSDKAFVTYQSAPRLRTGADDTAHFMMKERLIYTIVAPMPEVQYISNLIHAELSRFDASAAAINNHIQDSVVIFDSMTAYTVNLIDETTKYDSTNPRYSSEIIVDFDYRRADYEI